MKVRYEFEINKQEYDKVLCEACPMRNYSGTHLSCQLTEEIAPYRHDYESEKRYIDALSYLESKCPLEVVK